MRFNSGFKGLKGQDKSSGRKQGMRGQTSDSGARQRQRSYRYGREHQSINIVRFMVPLSHTIIFMLLYQIYDWP